MTVAVENHVTQPGRNGEFSHGQVPDDGSGRVLPIAGNVLVDVAAGTDRGLGGTDRPAQGMANDFAGSAGSDPAPQQRNGLRAVANSQVV